MTPDFEVFVCAAGDGVARALVQGSLQEDHSIKYKEKVEYHHKLGYGLSMLSQATGVLLALPSVCMCVHHVCIYVLVALG